MNKYFLTICIIIFLGLFIILTSFTYAAENKVYVAEIQYNQGEVTIDRVFVREGQASPVHSTVTYEYRLELISFNDEILESVPFNILRYISARPPLPGEEAQDNIILEEAQEVVFIPYHINGKLIRLYNNKDNKLLNEESVEYFADLCGDNICQNHESFLTCEQDCPAASQDGYCNQEEFNQDPDCQKGELEAKTLWQKIMDNKIIVIISSIIVICVIIMIAVYYFLVRKRKIDQDQDKQDKEDTSGMLNNQKS